MSSALKDNGSTSKWRKIRQRILQRDGYTCQACGGEGNSVDHILPRLAGGSDEDWNLQTLCGSCNSSKGGRFFIEPKTQIGRASVGKECSRRCRSRWSPYH
jgi:5-methylcytosine-specific restriction endonuclease McrA